MRLADGWAIQSSEEISAGGETISTRGYAAAGWYATSVPSTVLAALVKNGIYPDLYFGMNMDTIPEDIFQSSWWYRTEFHLPSNYAEKSVRPGLPDGNIWLHLDGIIFGANVWLNGHQIADGERVKGVYIPFEFNITEKVALGETNCLAIEVFPPQPGDLSVGFVDWNPPPPDKNIGLWKDVWVSTSGPVVMRHPFVRTDLPSLQEAKLTISVEVSNITRKPLRGTLNGKIENVKFSQTVELAPGETKLVTFSPEKFPQLNIVNPRLWWPNLVGPQNLYDGQLSFIVNGQVSDSKKIRFGIREVSSYLSENGHRIFQINGKNILIRGGGWTDDLLLCYSHKRVEAKVSYAKQMNFNAIRVEGIWGRDDLYDLCDQYGIMVLAGWTCHWEWDPYLGIPCDEYGGIRSEESMDLATEYWKQQIIRLRNHPGVICWLYGSDKPPRPELEQRYLDILNTYDGTRPSLSSATGKPTAITGQTGVKMNGPYEYVIPSYYYTDKTAGGAFGFATEEGPGAVVPPIESIRRMLPEDDLWPINETWYYHSSTRDGHRRDLNASRKGVNCRYGEAEGLEDYCKKSQLLDFEATRAMFEAWGRNKYLSTGIIAWMFNAAWPSVCWQLFDWYLLPGGAFYGARKACEPLHVQYSYDDDSIWVVNGHYQDFQDLKVSAKVYNLDGEEKYSNKATIDILSDTSKEVFTLKWTEDLSEVYFLKLALRDVADNLISSNFYWLSKEGDENADFSQLEMLPEVNLNISPSPLKKEGDIYSLRVDLGNPSGNLVFAVNPKIKKKISGDLVLPIYWEDNYFPLLPKESRQIKVEFNAEDLGGEQPVLVIDGWNVKTKSVLLN